MTQKEKYARQKNEVFCCDACKMICWNHAAEGGEPIVSWHGTYCSDMCYWDANEKITGCNQYGN